MTKQKLVDPIPCFMSLWTNAINMAWQLKPSTQDHLCITDVDNLLKSTRKRYVNHASCLVGEIHGFNDDYQKYGTRCKFCLSASTDEAARAIEYGGDILIKFKVRMYNHMIDKHGLKGKKIKLADIQKAITC